jgi:hypothetical protein
MAYLGYGIFFAGVSVEMWTITNQKNTIMKFSALMRFLLIAAPLCVLWGCGPEPEQKKTPNSEINSATKLGIDESHKAMGVGEGNQDERGEYPANQANLHPDSVRRDSIRPR